VDQLAGCADTPTDHRLPTEACCASGLALSGPAEPRCTHEAAGVVLELRNRGEDVPVSAWGSARDSPMRATRWAVPLMTVIAGLVPTDDVIGVHDASSLMKATVPLAHQAR